MIREFIFKALDTIVGAVVGVVHGLRGRHNCADLEVYSDEDRSAEATQVPEMATNVPRRAAVPCTCPDRSLHELECAYLHAAAPYGRCSKCNRALTLPPMWPSMIGPSYCGECSKRTSAPGSDPQGADTGTAAGRADRTGAVDATRELDPAPESTSNVATQVAGSTPAGSSGSRERGESSGDGVLRSNEVQPRRAGEDRLDPKDGPCLVRIHYFKPTSGKWYCEDENVEWKPDPNHFTGWQAFGELHRLRDMTAVCLQTPHGFPYSSPGDLSKWSNPDDRRESDPYEVAALLVERQASIHRMRAQSFADDSDRADGEAQADDIDRATAAAEALEYTASRIRELGRKGGGG